jgi:hypothetical protein
MHNPIVDNADTSRAINDVCICDSHTLWGYEEARTGRVGIRSRRKTDAEKSKNSGED